MFLLRYKTKIKAPRAATPKMLSMVAPAVAPGDDDDVEGGVSGLTVRLAAAEVLVEVVGNIDVLLDAVVDAAG